MTVEMFLVLVNWHRANPAACEDFCTKMGGTALVDMIRVAACTTTDSASTLD